MGELTFSKLQKKQYEEVKKLFSESDGCIELSDQDKARLFDVLLILEAKGYIREIRVDGANLYSKEVEFDSFDEWHKDREREERKLSAREWKIAIFSALIGLIPFIVTTVIPWIEDTALPWIMAFFH